MGNAEPCFQPEGIFNVNANGSFIAAADFG